MGKKLLIVESPAKSKTIGKYLGGELTVTFDDQAKASKVLPGMEMEVGDVEAEVLAVGTDSDGSVIASAHADIPDGSYGVRVGYKTTQVLSMLLN